MNIKDIFSKDLFRPINGVVKADQQDEAIVYQELDEYVVTRELDKHFRTFFGSYCKTIGAAADPNLSNHIGVWISGFFGSGKSHFLKIISYILANRQVYSLGTNEKRQAIDFFKTKFGSDPMLLADVTRSTQIGADVVLFNIDSKADPRDGHERLMNVFWKVFYELQGFCGEAPHIAEMERYLQNKGKLEVFQAAFKESAGIDWKQERDAWALNGDEIIGSLSKATGMSIEAAKEWFEKAESNVNLSPEAFSKRVKEYLDNRGTNSRVIFLVDEVGQFIGSDTQLMLNLQTITEDLGRVCQGRAWVVVTSQEDMDSILGDIKASKANDFSKIQGRFPTRVSLSSANTDEVIQIRLLEKTPDAAIALKSLFKLKGDILRNQLSFTSD
ncbi:MAG: BREX system P-loop protein BrxC, partial [Erysipelotrichia bacterium]|nr:BREX system P-loop protein BrxC [Erysipelotrichia bacterium]